MAVSLIARSECRDGARELVAGLIGAYSEQFVVIECYRDEDAFKAHLADSENAVFNDKLRPLISGDASELTFLEVP